MFFGDSHPRTQVTLIGGDRSFQGILGRAPPHPFPVVPFVIEIPYHRGGAWRFFVEQSEGVGLIDKMSVMTGFDVKLIERAFANSRNEAFPNAGTSARPQTMGFRMPLIKAADDGNFARIGGPHAEARSRLAAGFAGVRTHLFVHAIVAALVKQVKILVSEQRNVGSDSVSGAFDALAHKSARAGPADCPPSVPTWGPTLMLDCGILESPSRRECFHHACAARRSALAPAPALL